MARHVLLVKSHVSAFTRKDGAFVAAHDDKRTKAAKPAAEHPIPSKPSGIPDNYHSTLDYLASKTQGFIKTDPQAGLDFLYKQKNNWKKDTSEAEHAPKVIKYISELINHLTAAASSAGDSPAPAPANADTNQKDWGKLPDDDNPTYAMRGLESTHLGHIASGKVDAKRIAHDELASRGQDSNGKWIGFDKAKEHHDALKGKDKPHPSNKRVAEHMQSVGSDILSSAVKGHIDLGKRADAELDNRNHDRSGNWIKK